MCTYKIKGYVYLKPYLFDIYIDGCLKTLILHFYY